MDSKILTVRYCLCKCQLGKKLTTVKRVLKTANQNETMLQLYIWSEEQFAKKQVVNSINPCDLQTFGWCCHPYRCHMNSCSFSFGT